MHTPDSVNELRKLFTQYKNFIEQVYGDTDKTPNTQKEDLSLADISLSPGVAASDTAVETPSTAIAEIWELNSLMFQKSILATLTRGIEEGRLPSMEEVNILKSLSDLIY